jgi:TorA maturation chaperone TorD
MKLENEDIKMSNQEKGQFCWFAAALLARPDAALLDDLLQERLCSRLEMLIGLWGGGAELFSGLLGRLNSEDFLQTLEQEYGRLFVEQEGSKISLVESTYKPWTSDKSCGMVFSASKGLVMGDSAIHMLDIYEELSLDVPEEFRSMPDHLVLEMEFLALLYQSAPQETIDGFIEDHLDWIQELRGEMEKANPHPFYWNAIHLIDLFLKNEAKNREDMNHGEKRIN